MPDGRRAGGQLEQRPLGGLAGDVVDVVGVEQLEADGAAERLVAGLHAGVARGHRHDREQRAHLVVLGEQAVAVGDEDAPAAVAVAGGDLGDGRAGAAGGGVGSAEEVDLAWPWRRPPGRIAMSLGRGASWRVRATSTTRRRPSGPPRRPPRPRPAAGLGQVRRARLGEQQPAHGRRLEVARQPRDIRQPEVGILVEDAQARARVPGEVHAAAHVGAQRGDDAAHRLRRTGGGDEVRELGDLASEGEARQVAQAHEVLLLHEQVQQAVGGGPRHPETGGDLPRGHARAAAGDLLEHRERTVDRLGLPCVQPEVAARVSRHADRPSPRRPTPASGMPPSTSPATAWS